MEFYCATDCYQPRGALLLHPFTPSLTRGPSAVCSCCTVVVFPQALLWHSRLMEPGFLLRPSPRGWRRSGDCLAGFWRAERVCAPLSLPVQAFNRCVAILREARQILPRPAECRLTYQCWSVRWRLHQCHALMWLPTSLSATRKCQSPFMVLLRHVCDTNVLPNTPHINMSSPVITPWICSFQIQRRKMISIPLFCLCN